MRFTDRVKNSCFLMGRACTNCLSGFCCPGLPAGDFGQPKKKVPRPRSNSLPQATLSRRTSRTALTIKDKSKKKSIDAKITGGGRKILLKGGLSQESDKANIGVQKDIHSIHSMDEKSRHICQCTVFFNRCKLIGNFRYFITLFFDIDTHVRTITDNNSRKIKRMCD